MRARGLGVWFDSVLMVGVEKEFENDSLFEHDVI